VEGNHGYKLALAATDAICFKGIIFSPSSLSNHDNVQEFIPSQFIIINSLSKKIGQDNTRFSCTSFSREKIFSLRFHTDIKDHKSATIYQESCIQLVIAD